MDLDESVRFARSYGRRGSWLYELLRRLWRATPYMGLRRRIEQLERDQRRQTRWLHQRVQELEDQQLRERFPTHG